MSDRSDALAARLLNCYAAAVHDVLRALGHGRCVLPPSIRALDPSKKLAGEIYTVGGHIDMTRDPHDTLVQWTGLLSKAPPGKVLVCQPHTYEIALMGELSAETLNFRGIRGYVVDGGCRDTDFILELGFPVFCSFNTPKDIVGRWVPDRLGEGTALLACHTPFAIAFGPGSFARHVDAGAVPIGLDESAARCDVDTPDDLEVARAVGLGRHTAQALEAVYAS